MKQSDHDKTSVLKVVVVEDDLLDFELLESALVSQLHCEVHLARTKSQLEGELAQKCPDLIISDSSIRGFDGLAALKFATENCPGVPFVFCSGKLEADAETEIFARKVKWFHKEKDFVSLIAFVRQVQCHEIKSECNDSGCRN